MKELTHYGKILHLAKIAQKKGMYIARQEYAKAALTRCREKNVLKQLA